jgi:hypothetical protein
MKTFSPPEKKKFTPSHENFFPSHEKKKFTHLPTKLFPAHETKSLLPPMKTFSRPRKKKFSPGKFFPPGKKIPRPVRKRKK